MYFGILAGIKPASALRRCTGRTNEMDVRIQQTMRKKRDGDDAQASGDIE